MLQLIIISSLLFSITTCAVAQPKGPRGGKRGFSASAALPEGTTDAERKALAVLKQSNDEGETFANVPVSDGRMLRILTESLGAKNVVEIGTSTGLSGIWFSMALQRTGGKLTTFEYDAGRAAMARKHFQQAGVDKLVTIVEGDAHKTIERLKEPIDVLFIDADKEGYTDYLQRLLPLVRPGGLILAHNIDMVEDYRKAVTSNAALDTVFYMDGGGLGITMKKR